MEPDEPTADQIDCVDHLAVLEHVGIRGEPTEEDYRRAELLWTRTTGNDFLELPEAQRRWSAMLSRLVREEHRLYRCALCLDRGYRERDIDINGGFECRASYCDSCEVGIAAESGYWAEKLTPGKSARAGVRPQVSDEVKAAFLRRLREHSRGVDLRSRVDRLITSGAPAEES